MSDRQGMTVTNAYMREILSLLEDISPYEVTILLTGERGAGKEYLARYIHQTGTRKNGPFIPVNCSALSPENVQSALYGYEIPESGNRREEGYFPRAENGTLYLDEINHLPLPDQVELLQNLDEGVYRTHDTRKQMPITCRLICSSYESLYNLVVKGAFRQDLHYRLQTIPIDIPPLRERLEDIPLLVQEFVRECEVLYQKEPVTFTSEAVKKLQSYSWPGNIRQLKHYIHRICLTTKEQQVSGVIIPEDPHLDPTYADTLNLSERMQLVELDTIKEVLDQTENNREKAAKILGISQQTLRKKLKIYSEELTGVKNNGR